MRSRPVGRLVGPATLDALAPDTLETYLNTQLDLADLPHHTFSDEALHPVLRVSEGVLRAVRNLCVGSLIEAVRDRTKTVDLKQVNAVLMQPHWRHNTRDEARQSVVFTNQKPKN
jgi:type II secretory pathway predicted ATPase ExeA